MHSLVSTKQIAKIFKLFLLDLTEIQDKTLWVGEGEGRDMGREGRKVKFT